MAILSLQHSTRSPLGESGASASKQYNETTTDSARLPLPPLGTISPSGLLTPSAASAFPPSPTAPPPVTFKARTKVMATHCERWSL